MAFVEQQKASVGTDLRELLDRSARRASIAALRTRYVLYGATAAYALVFVGAAVLHFRGYQSGRGDLGNMVQAVWSTAHGHFLQVTDLSGREMSRLGAHVDPFLALLVPLWWAWPSGLMLLVVQALAVSAGALPVFWLARKHLQSDRAGLHFAFAYLLYPATQFNAFTISSGFHSVSIAVPLILFAIWFLDEDRLVPFALFAILAASTKEEIAAAVGCLGIWYAVRRGKRVAGLSIFVLGLAVTLVDFLVIIPHYAANGSDPFAARYSGVGGTPTGIVHKAFTDPGALVHAVASGHKLAYVALLFVPVLGLCLLEPLLFLGAVPDLAVNLLSSKGDQTVIAYHWTAGIVPFTIAAAVLGAGRLRKNPEWVSLIVLAAVACTAIYSPIYLAVIRGDYSLAQHPSATRAAKIHALSLVPASAPVAASNQLGAYVSARCFVYVFPYVRKANWVVLDEKNPSVVSPKAYATAIRRIDSSRSWKIVFASHGVQVLRRVGPIQASG